MLGVKHKDIIQLINTNSIKSFQERIENKNPDDCWQWLGGTNKHGYGRLSVKNQQGEWILIQAHRFSWVYHNRRNIPGDLHICHACDNPSCVNPSHLQAATYQENHRQKAERKRANYAASRGERNAQSKLTNTEVLHIYSLKGKYSQRDIGRIYNISHSTVGTIHLKKQWRHILANLS